MPANIALLWYTGMSLDDNQNNSVRDYDDQYDDEEISESGGSSPGHSDDVEVVDTRPVGGRPAKASPTAPIQSTSSKAPPKKKGKNQHTADQPPLESRPSGSLVAPDQNKSTRKRPMEVEVAVAEALTDVHAADPKRARLAGETPRLKCISESGRLPIQLGPLGVSSMNIHSHHPQLRTLKPLVSMMILVALATNGVDDALATNGVDDALSCGRKWRKWKMDEV
nr:uncharacterized protein LOC109149872 [Ipomoea batatas]